MHFHSTEMYQNILELDMDVDWLTVEWFLYGQLGLTWTDSRNQTDSSISCSIFNNFIVPWSTSVCSVYVIVSDIEYALGRVCFAVLCMLALYRRDFH